MAVPPVAFRWITAFFAATLVLGLAMASVPSSGYSGSARPLPAIRANSTPSGIMFTAALAARRTALILVAGVFIDPEQSMMTICALSAGGAARGRGATGGKYAGGGREAEGGREALSSAGRGRG